MTSDGYFLVVSKAELCPSFHSQFIDEERKLCIYGYATSEAIADEYIRQFINRKGMWYVSVPKSLIEYYDHILGIPLIGNYACEYNEDGEPSFRMVATEQELESLYEIQGDGFDTEDEDVAILQMNKILKGYNTRTAKKLKKCLAKFAKEVHYETDQFVPHTRKWFLIKMRTCGFR